MPSFIYKVVCALASLCVLVTAVPLCTRPSDAVLTAQLVTSMGNDTTGDPRTIEATRVISQEAFKGLPDTQCPTTPPAAGVFHPLHERSTCPYDYVIDHDPARFPMTLAETFCKCDNCLVRIGDTLQKTANECVPIPYKVHVLVQTGNCVNGYYEYAAAWQTINAGCTCAMPNTHVSGSESTPAPADEGDGPVMAS